MIIKIYVLKDPFSNIIRYVGKTKGNLKTRLSNHLTDKRSNHKTCWIKSLKGIKPIMEVIDETDNFEKSSELEKYYIEKFKKEGLNLVNSTLGGEGTLGRVVTKEQRISQSKKLLGRFKGKNNPFYGKTHSIETKTAISKGNKGKIRTEEVKKQMSLSRKDFKPSKDHILKLKETFSKKVIQKDKQGNFIKEWGSTTEPASYGFIQARISNCCNGKRKSHGGFIWEFKSKSYDTRMAV